MITENPKENQRNKMSPWFFLPEKQYSGNEPKSRYKATKKHFMSYKTQAREEG